MTLPLYGKALASAGFEPGKARSVIRVRSIESSVERHPSDFALVRTSDQFERAIAAKWRSAFIVSDRPVQEELAGFNGRLVAVASKYDYLQDGDVLGFDHLSGKFRTLFRRNSAHNSFLVTERCNNYCLMCSQPPKDVDDRWLLAEIKESLALIDPTTRALTFTGGETLSDWADFVDVLKACHGLLPATALQVLTNGRAFASSQIVDAWRDVRHPNLMAAIPVYASVDHVHDYVVQAKGAFDETILGILKLKDRSQRVEIRVVLHALTAPIVAETCRWIARNLPFVDHVALMGLENTGFAIANDALLWMDPMDYRDALAEAVEHLVAAGVNVSVYIRARKIDVIVVYKVDRLTRSLADFAKLVELFDAHGVSFVSVTQQFNTTTSMGRLTLNVLLSFAQFEREVTSERIRDKIAASKRKGLWVGGNLPLGYEMKDGKIAIVEEEAERVRSIFRRYLELGSVNELLRDLRVCDIRTKSKLLSTGATRGGIPFGRGTLYYLLSNRFYIGEVKYKDEILPGEQPPIMERALFEAVRQRSLAQWSHRTVARNKSDQLLTGLLFDDAGHRMIPTHAKKAGIRYRYYASTTVLHGEAKTASAGSVSRVPAADIEDIIIKSLEAHLAAQQDGPTSSAVQFRDRAALAQLIASIFVHPDRLVVQFKPDETDEASDRADGRSLTIPWQKPPSKRARRILLPHGKTRSDARPEQFERRARLVNAIAKGRQWLDDVISGRVTNITELCTREKCSVRQANMTISLAFLAPTLVKAAVEGRLPRGIGIERLRDLPTEWSQQFEAFGLSPNVG